MDDRYKLLKNFIHNEMNITRDEVREWVKEAAVATAQQEFRRMLQQENMQAFFKKLCEEELKKAIGFGSSFNSRDSLLSKAIADKICQHVFARMQIKIGDPHPDAPFPNLVTEAEQPT